MYYLEITKDMETSEPVELTTEVANHAVKVIGYKVAKDWRKSYRIDEREYDGDTEGLKEDLDYIQDGLQEILTDDYMAIWTRD